MPLVANLQCVFCGAPASFWDAAVLGFGCKASCVRFYARALIPMRAAFAMTQGLDRARIATKRNAAERELDGASDLDGLEEDYFFFAFLAGFAAFFAAFFATFLAILASPDCGRSKHHA
jgi:hypothetical protein